MHAKIKDVDDCFGSCAYEEAVVQGLDAIDWIAVHDVYIFPLKHLGRAKVMESAGFKISILKPIFLYWKNKIYLTLLFPQPARNTSPGALPPYESTPSDAMAPTRAFLRGHNVR